MAVPTDPAANTPTWWLLKLEQRLHERQAEMELMNRYYVGEHPLPFLTPAHAEKVRNEFRRLLDESRSNFMRLVVDSTEERLQVEGFRLSAQTDPTADEKSWEIWQANQMDANSQSAFIEALVKGVSYLSVWGADKGSNYPTIAVEDPTQTIVGYAAGSNYGKRAAALKVWEDEWTGLRRANVYLPEGIYKFQGRGPAPTSVVMPYGVTEPLRWTPLNGDTSWTADGFVKNPFGVVPIIPLRNRPRLLCEGESEIADVYRIQNSINGFLFLLALAGYMGAHRQRWAVGLKILKNEVTGEDMDPFDVAIDRLWQTENPEVKFGEFEQTQLEPYIAAIEQKVLHIAVTTRTPRHYLIQSGQSPSGDAIQSAESGLVKKVERKQRPFGEGLEEAMRLARRFAGEKEVAPTSEVVWANAQTEGIARLTDAVIKQYAEGLVPWEAALEELGYTQVQIARFTRMRASDQLLKDMLNPPAPLPAKNEPPVVEA